MKLESFAVMRAAEGRSASEDFVFADDNAGIFIVADGMGGRPGGALASETATNSVKDYLLKMKPAKRMADRRLNDAIVRAGKSVLSLGKQDPTVSGMGTTLSAVVVDGSQAKIVHVGDSRVYLIRNNEIVQLTKDQTLAAELVDRSILSETVAEAHPFRNVLAQSVGSDTRIKPEIVDLTLVPHDLLLLATDGLMKAASTEQIVSAAGEPSSRTPQEVVHALMDKCLSSPLEDDVGIVVVTVEENADG